jgi:hypothetical protein
LATGTLVDKASEKVSVGLSLEILSVAIGLAWLMIFPASRKVAKQGKLSVKKSELSAKN